MGNHVSANEDFG